MALTLSKSAFARERGVTPAMVTFWRKKDLIVLTEDGQVDVDASNKLLDAAQDPSRGGKVGRADTTLPEAPVATESSSKSYTDVRTEREEWTLKSQRVEYEKMVGTLVERDAYNRALMQNLSPALQRLDTISARLGARLAAETDVRKCQDMIDEEVESIRQEIADNAQAMIDGAGRTRQ